MIHNLIFLNHFKSCAKDFKCENLKDTGDSTVEIPRYTKASYVIISQKLLLTTFCTDDRLGCRRGLAGADCIPSKYPELVLTPVNQSRCCVGWTRNSGLVNTDPSWSTHLPLLNDIIKDLWTAVGVRRRPSEDGRVTVDLQIFRTSGSRRYFWVTGN